MFAATHKNFAVLIRKNFFSFGASLNPIALRKAKMAFLSAIGLKRRLFTLTNLFSLGLLLKATLPVLVLLSFPLGVRFCQMLLGKQILSIVIIPL